MRMVMKFGLLCILVGSVTAAIIKDDFLVNDDITGGCIHSGPRIAMNSSGCFVVVWNDQRDGDENGDIYGQLFDSPGKPHGPNFKINDDGVLGKRQYSPSAAMNEDGSFFVIWADERNRSPFEGTDIFGQLFDSAGKPVGINYAVEDEWYDHQLPSISTDGAARCVAVWQAWLSGSNNIVHASDTVLNGETEVGRFFDKGELFNYKKTNYEHIYGK